MQNPILPNYQLPAIVTLCQGVSKLQPEGYIRPSLPFCLACLLQPVHRGKGGVRVAGMHAGGCLSMHTFLFPQPSEMLKISGVVLTVKSLETPALC